VGTTASRFEKRSLRPFLLIGLEELVIRRSPDVRYDAGGVNMWSTPRCLHNNLRDRRFLGCRRGIRCPRCVKYAAGSRYLDVIIRGERRRNRRHSSGRGGRLERISTVRRDGSGCSKLGAAHDHGVSMWRRRGRVPCQTRPGPAAVVRSGAPQLPATLWITSKRPLASSYAGDGGREVAVGGSQLTLCRSSQAPEGRMAHRSFRPTYPRTNAGPSCPSAGRGSRPELHRPGDHGDLARLRSAGRVPCG